MRSIVAALVVALACCANGLKVKSHKAYGTKEEITSDKTALSLQFALDQQDQELYADIDGVLSPVACSGASYQVSWVLPYDQVKVGDHTVALYTKDGYAALKKYRAEGEGEQPKPVETFNVPHAGVAKTDFPVPLSAVAVVGSIAAFALVKSTVNTITATD